MDHIRANFTNDMILSNTPVTTFERWPIPLIGATWNSSWRARGIQKLHELNFLNTGFLKFVMTNRWNYSGTGIEPKWEPPPRKIWESRSCSTRTPTLMALKEVDSLIHEKLATNIQQVVVESKDWTNQSPYVLCLLKDKKVKESRIHLAQWNEWHHSKPSEISSYDSRRDIQGIRVAQE